jgi:ribosome maturation factor RimP
MTTAAGLRERLIGLVEPLLTQLGYELVDIEWHGAQRDGVMRVYIDRLPGREGGHIGIEDCERASREMSALLDVEDPIPGAYSLEVSSPGFDRVLRKPEHFGRFVGSRVRVELEVPREGRRRYTGKLVAAGPTEIELEVDDMAVAVKFTEIGKARVVA